MNDVIRKTASSVCIYYTFIFYTLLYICFLLYIYSFFFNINSSIIYYLKQVYSNKIIMQFSQKPSLTCIFIILNLNFISSLKNIFSHPISFKNIFRINICLIFLFNLLNVTKKSFQNHLVSKKKSAVI